MLRFCRLLFAAAVVAVGVPALAAQSAFIGNWGTSAAQCNLPQDNEAAPMIITAHGYDQHEAHCRFVSITPDGGGWKATATCSVEGNKQRDAFRLHVAGDTMTLRRGRVAKRFQRCG